MRRALAVVANPEADADAKAEALEELQFFVESVDNASDLEKMKGLPVVMGALGDGDAGVRALAAHTLATALQHNERVQRAAVELKLVPLLLEKLQSDPSGDVRSKAVLALSALVRHSEEGGLAFVASGGFPALARLFATETDVRALRRGAFLAYALCGEKAAYALRLIDAEAVAPLALLLRRDDDPDLREKVLQALEALAATGVAQEGIATLRAIKEPSLAETLAAWRASTASASAPAADQGAREGEEGGGLSRETEATIDRLLAHLAPKQ
eukprot:tig00001590_g9376.t1